MSDRLAPITSYSSGPCLVCGYRWLRGDIIIKLARGKYIHEKCWQDDLTVEV